MKENDSNTYHLEPGYIYTSTTGDVIRAVIGSSVMVCIWDSKKRIGGACNFLYPIAKKKENRNGKFGDVAITHLIKLLEKYGSQKPNLTAQVYGGGSLIKDTQKKYTKNIKTARKTLSKNNIKIVSEDIGGSMGRKILFDTASGHAAVLKVHETRDDDWF